MSALALWLIAKAKQAAHVRYQNHPDEELNVVAVAFSLWTCSLRSFCEIAGVVVDPWLPNFKACVMQLEREGPMWLGASAARQHGYFLNESPVAMNLVDLDKRAVWEEMQHYKMMLAEWRADLDTVTSGAFDRALIAIISCGENLYDWTRATPVQELGDKFNLLNTAISEVLQWRSMRLTPPRRIVLEPSSGADARMADLATVVRSHQLNLAISTDRAREAMADDLAN